MAEVLTLADETAAKLADLQGPDDTSFEDVILRLATDAEAGPEQLATTPRDERAKGAMLITDMKEATREGVSAAEYMASTYDVDASEYGTDEAYAEAVREARRDG